MVWENWCKEIKRLGVDQDLEAGILSIMPKNMKVTIDRKTTGGASILNVYSSGIPKIKVVVRNYKITKVNLCT